ncbi:MAG: nitrogen regulation protein NR(I) [Acidiferrobacterales bacterium]
MDRQGLVWVIDDDRSIRWVLEKALERARLSVRCFPSADDIPTLLDRQRPDVIITDVRMPGLSGLELLQAINAKAPDIPVIIITAHTGLDSAVASYRGGAFEYLPKPFDIDEAVELTRRALEQSQQKGVPTPESSKHEPRIIGEAPAMQEAFRAIGRLSNAHFSVLISGESGTGKELVARALHNHSARANKPLIVINTAAVPRELLESELFGHERGAFTGAHMQRKGRFEQADGGTLFLDEVGDMPPELQTRLLRVLADGRFYRLGGHEEIETNVRVIAATNQDLEQRVREGQFREDLYHRLNVIRVHLPPLRERREDIPTLLRYFLQTSAEELGVKPKQIASETEAQLCRLPWRGNVRQLENFCRWLTVMAPGQTAQPADLPPELRELHPSIDTGSEWERSLRDVASRWLVRGESSVFKQLNARFERVLIETALTHTSGRKQDAAQRLGLGRNTLTRKLKELGLTDRD